MHLFLNLSASHSHQDLSINKPKRIGAITLRWCYGTFATEMTQFISVCPFQDLNPSSSHTTVTIINRRHQIGSNILIPACIVNNQGLLLSEKINQTGDQNFEANVQEGASVHIITNNIMGEECKNRSNCLAKWMLAYLLEAYLHSCY